MLSHNRQPRHSIRHLNHQSEGKESTSPSRVLYPVLDSLKCVLAFSASPRFRPSLLRTAVRDDGAPSAEISKIDLHHIWSLTTCR